MHQADERRAAYRLRGRVQGVGFRWWTLRLARELGLRGTVRNCPDGSVEVRAAGRPEAVARLEAALHAGPPHARVDVVEALPGPDDLPPDFQVTG